MEKFANAYIFKTESLGKERIAHGGVEGCREGKIARQPTTLLNKRIRWLYLIWREGSRKCTLSSSNLAKPAFEYTRIGRVPFSNFATPRTVRAFRDPAGLRSMSRKPRRKLCLRSANFSISRCVRRVKGRSVTRLRQTDEIEVNSRLSSRESFCVRKLSTIIHRSYEPLFSIRENPRIDANDRQIGQSVDPSLRRKR